MNPDKLTKEVILQQLKCLSKRYGELLKYFDETENTIQKPTTYKRSWADFFKKDKINAKTTSSNDESGY